MGLQSTAEGKGKEGLGDASPSTKTCWGHWGEVRAEKWKASSYFPLSKAASLSLLVQAGDLHCHLVSCEQLFGLKLGKWEVSHE